MLPGDACTSTDMHALVFTFSGEKDTLRLDTVHTQRPGLRAFEIPLRVCIMRDARFQGSHPLGSHPKTVPPAHADTQTGARVGTRPCFSAAITAKAASTATLGSASAGAGTAHLFPLWW